LKVTTERLPGCQVKLTVEIDPGRVEESLRQTTRRLSRQMRIPGFRPGKAPYHVMVRRLGREALLQEVVEGKGQGWYEEALKETDLEPYGQAQLELTSYDPLVMTFTLPVAPVVDLGEYQDLRLDWEPPLVSDEDEQEALARLQQESASLEPIERPAELEDVATLDIEGHIGDDVVVDMKERSVTLTQDVNYPVAGFVEKIVGMSPGQDCEFTLTYPQDHANAAWAGKEAHFKVHMHGLKVWVTPQLDDELAKTMGNYATLDEWRASVREGLEAQALKQAEDDYADAAVDALADQAHIEFPAVMVKHRLDSMMEDADQSLRQRGLGLENYLIMAGQSREEYRESMRETAEKQLTKGLVLAELVRAEELEVSEADIDAEIDRLVERLGNEAGDFRQALANEDMRDSLRSSLLTQAAKDTLKAIARGEYVSQAATEPQEEEGQATPEAELEETAKEAVEVNGEELIDKAPCDEVPESDG